MEDIKLTGLDRLGEELAEQDHIKSYTQTVFSMFGGEKKTVKIKFVKSALDAVVDKLGTDLKRYEKIDDHHFVLTTNVEVSPQFYSWLCGFGISAEILEPKEVRKEFKEYVSKIAKKYK